MIFLAVWSFCGFLSSGMAAIKRTPTVLNKEFDASVALKDHEGLNSHRRVSHAFDVMTMGWSVWGRHRKTSFRAKSVAGPRFSTCHINLAKMSKETAKRTFPLLSCFIKKRHSVLLERQLRQPRCYSSRLLFRYNSQTYYNNAIKIHSYSTTTCQ